MDWIKRNWKHLLQAGCAVAGGVAIAVPAVAPLALACAVAVPTITTAPDVWTGIKNIMAIIGPPAK